MIKLKSDRISFMKLKAFLLLGIASLLFNHCDVPDGAPSWNPDYYGPIARSKVNVEELSKLSDEKFTQDVEATEVRSDLEGDKNIPGFRLENTRVKEPDPYEFEITDVFERVRTDSLIFKISFTNDYPINIKKGTVLTFENKSDGNVVYQHEITEDVDPGESYSVKERLFDKDIESNINYYLDNFGTDGTEGETRNFEEGLDISFNFELIFLEIEELVLKTPQEYSLNDTAEFDFAQADTATSARGNLFVYFDNQFPLKFNVQLYLHDRNNFLIDSLFENPIELGGTPVNANGRVIGSQITAVDTVNLNEAKINKFRKAKFIDAKLFVRTVNKDRNGQDLDNIKLKVEDQSFLNLQIAADVEGIVN